jgi:hypothetical protein
MASTQDLSISRANFLIPVTQMEPDKADQLVILPGVRRLFKNGAGMLFYSPLFLHAPNLS